LLSLQAALPHALLQWAGSALLQMHSSQQHSTQLPLQAWCVLPQRLLF
jgi:hypothetical protein